MVQRAGCIDRIGSPFETLRVYNVFPEAGLERLLRLVESLQEELATIDTFGMLETSVLGEAVHPRTFNTLQRIADEEQSVLEELQMESELGSSEFLLASLQDALASGEVDLENVPDGIHSGRERKDYRGLFVYFTAAAQQDDGEDRRHFWRYYDLESGRILENRYEIATLIRCGPDEPRVIGEDVNVFEIQDRVIDEILSSVRNQQAIEGAPKIMADEQQLVATVLQNQRNNPAVDLEEMRTALTKLREPLSRAYLGDLRKAYDEYRRDGNVKALLTTVQALETTSGEQKSVETRPQPLTKDDLHLNCWEYVWS